MRLKTLIASAISLVSLTLTASVSYFIGNDALHRLEDSIGRSLALLADEAQDKLDRGMYERLQALQLLNSVAELALKAEQPLEIQQSLSHFKETYPDFAWIGLADQRGRILTATERAMDGRNVSDEAWFLGGKSGPFVGEAEILLGSEGQSRLLEASKGFIDIAVPIDFGDPQQKGVLGANLGPDWANDVRDTLLGGLEKAEQAEVIVMDEHGWALLGPPGLQGSKHALPSVKAVKPGISNYTAEQWPDGKFYLTGSSKSDGYRSNPGLHWIVFVREAKALAFAPVERLHHNIIILGIAFSGLAAALGWLLATRLSLPLLQLSDSAEKLRLGRQPEIPEVGGYEEARVLSRSLRTLVSDLKIQKASLAEANQSLEAQVKERTKQLEQQNLSLEKAKTEAELATESKSRFLAAASHDLRQPLHAITLFSRALSSRVHGDETRTLVAQMEEALRGLKGMFDALLNVSRLDAKLIEPVSEPVSISLIIDRVSAGARAEAQQTGLKFLSRSSDWTLETDAALLETIVRNLVSNALKFTRSGGVILAARMRKGRRVIDVYDTGPGLNNEQQEVIFKEFTRTDLTASGANDGLGLGLSIAQRYAELLGMRIELCSRPHRGSRFTIVLPSGSSCIVQRQSRSFSRSKGDLGGYRILVLDDDSLIVSALVRTLNDCGSHAFGFQRIAEVEAALSRGASFEAAIVDYDLREAETGLEFVERIARLGRRPFPALVLSGGTDSATLATLSRSGRPWLTKPADPELILVSLRAAFDGDYNETETAVRADT